MVVPWIPTRLQFLVVCQNLWLTVHYKREFWLLYKFMVVHRTTASLFFIVWQLFWLSQVNRQPLFPPLVTIFSKQIGEKILGKIGEAGRVVFLPQSIKSFSKTIKINLLESNDHTRSNHLK